MERKLIANLNQNGLGNISTHHKAQSMEFEARIYCGFLGNNETIKEMAKNRLINCKDLDLIVINGVRLK